MRGRFSLFLEKGERVADRKALVTWCFHHVVGRQEGRQPAPVTKMSLQAFRSSWSACQHRQPCGHSHEGSPKAQEGRRQGQQVLGLTWFPSYSVWETCQNVEPGLGVSSSKGISTQSPSRGSSLLFILIGVLGSWILSRLACPFPQEMVQ